MSEKTLKFNSLRVDKKEFHKSKQPIEIMYNEIMKYLSIVTKVLSILLVTKRVKLLNCYALSHLKCVDTSNTLETVAKTWLF